jgi:beta-lactamase class D
VVREIMIEERGSGYVLRGKSGWAQRLSAAGRSLRELPTIDIPKPSDAEQRRAIARRILEDEGLLDDRPR